MTPGERIRMLRTIKLGMTQGELGAKLGVSAMAVSKWEHGTAWPEPEHLDSLAAIGGVPRKWFTLHFSNFMPKAGVETVYLLGLLSADEQEDFYDMVGMMLSKRFERER